MNERNAPRLRRALLLTQGAAAEAVAENTLALGRAWLGFEPPLVRVPLSPGMAAGTADAPAWSTLAEACDRLADGALVTRLQEAGWALAKPDELEAWLIIEADREPCDAQPRSDASAGCAGADAPPTTLVPALAELAWRHLRVHVTARALLLAEPATQEYAAAWAIQLANAGVERMGLVGPVDAERLRWDPCHWQAAAARSLATLLWSDATLGPGVENLLSEAERWPQPLTVGPEGPSQLQPADFQPPVLGLADAPLSAAPGPAAVWGIGAAAWPTPQAEIKRWLIPHCARMVTARLLGAAAAAGDAAEAGVPEPAAELPPWELPALTVAPERHRLSVDVAVPQEPPGLVWGRRRPAWPALAGLPDALRTAAEQRAAQAHDEQYGPRGAWLEHQVAAWAEALGQLRDERLAPHAERGWPEASRLQAELQAQTARLRAACALIEDWLEAAGARFAEAEEEVMRTGRALAELCRSFPEPSPQGLWALLARPWRWPALAWAYLALLPQQGQRYLDTFYRRGAARWAEANLHALRQAYLAMAQIVQEQQREVEALIERIGAIDAELARRLAAEAEPPLPWDAGRLAGLAQRALVGRSAGPGLGWVMAEADPSVGSGPADCSESGPPAPPILGGTWLPPQSGGGGGVVTRRGAAPGMGICLATRLDSQSALTRLTAWVMERLAPLDRWTAADWLAAGLDDVTLPQWLSRFAGQATPLWPAAASQAEAMTWLLCPVRNAQGSPDEAGAEERLQAGMQAWARQQAAGDDHLYLGSSYADVLLVLRGVKVRLEDREET